MPIFRTKFSERQARQWGAIGENGKISWILTRGVIGWGTTMFMWMTAWKLYTSDKDFLSRSQITIDLILWPIAGFFFGLLTWHTSEKAYKAFLNKK